MIFYYSGTGNSRYVALQLAKLIRDEAVNILDNDLDADKLRQAIALSVDVGFVFPVYSWGPAPAIVEFVASLPDNILRSKYVWMVCTCGDETGLTHRMFGKSIQKKGGYLEAIFSVIMPNNYVLLPGFGIDPKDVEEKKLGSVSARLRNISESLRNKDTVVDIQCGSWPVLKSAVYPLFRRWGVQPRKWHSTDACISCGQCARVCPNHNINMSPDKDGKSRPVWGTDCLSCCACFHVCPSNAVQYGTFTRKYGQYRHFLKSE